MSSNFRPQELPKDDPRFILWKKSLSRRPAPWNKGLNKLTHESLRKVSETFKRNSIDNFANWRKENINNHVRLKHSQSLALLTGLILGDGHIERFPRTERLIITLGTDKPGLILLAIDLVYKIFKKRLTVRKVKNSNCVKIWFVKYPIS